MNPDRLIAVGLVCLAVIFGMALFPPVRTTEEQYFGRAGEVLAKPEVRTSYSYEFIASVPLRPISLAGLNASVDWALLARQTVVVLILGGVAVWVGRFKNSADEEKADEGA